MPSMTLQRRLITTSNIDPDQAAMARAARADVTVIRGKGIWPLNARGMSPPGPDFMAMARCLGDESQIEEIRVAVDNQDTPVVAEATLTQDPEQLDLFEGDATKKKKTKKPKVKTRTEKRLIVGAQLPSLMLKALRKPGFSMLVKCGLAGQKQAVFVPGHIWGQNASAYANNQESTVDGPAPADVMIIGKMPGEQETNDGRCLVGPTSQLFLDCLRSLHFEGMEKWYVTNLCKFKPPDSSGTLKANWLADCIPLLEQELRIVRPKYILCLGSDASKALLGTRNNVGRMDGRVEEFTYPIDHDYDLPASQQRTHTALVMTVTHPAAVSRSPDLYRVLERGLARFKLLISGVRFDKEEIDIDHRHIHTLEELETLFYEIDNDPEKTDSWIAIDAEWHGEHPVNAGSYLRTIQFGWRPKHAAVVVWAEPGGKMFIRDEYGYDARDRAVVAINRFLANKRVCGHFLVADLEWLVHAGITMARDRFKVPLYDCPFDKFHKSKQRVLASKGFKPGDIVPAWSRTFVEGGFDTGLAGHAIEETAQLGLEALAMRYTTCPRWDIPLEAEKEKMCKVRGIKPKDLEGYGEIPDPVLLPYACLHGESLVQLADGSWRKIRKLVRQRYTGQVRCFIDGKVTVASVTDWHRADVKQKEWFKLVTTSTPRGRHGLLGPALTPDHKVLTQRGKVEVGMLRVGSDAILTDEFEFSPQQLSVVLGCLLGDGGYTRKNNRRCGFGFGQRTTKKAYLDWKADALSTHQPRAVTMKNGQSRYVLPFTRYLAELTARYPAKSTAEHSKRKTVISESLLSRLGDLGLAVWYQDDGTLVKPYKGSQYTSRIYCHINAQEQAIVVAWLSDRFGSGVTYNKNSHFIQITREAFTAFHAAINKFMHPAMAYKTPLSVRGLPVVFKQGVPFYATIDAVERVYPRPGSRGNGVRYCLSVPAAGNFLTKEGFVSNCYDTDATLRLMYEQIPLLERDYEGNTCREPFWESMIVTMPILEMHQEGLCLDKQRLDYLTKAFMASRARQEMEIQQWAKWPTFNIRSVQHVREFLFNEYLNGKRDKQGNHVRIRPPDGISLGLTPVIDTGKPPKKWEDIKEAGLEAQHSPGTSKTVLGVLAADNPEAFKQVQWVRDFRFVDQVLKSVLRPPKLDAQGQPVLKTDGTDDAESAVISNESMEVTATTAAAAVAVEAFVGRDNLSGLVYEAGLASVVCDDGRIRTHLYPTAETGRWRSARPPLQNMSKRRDSDYKRIMGADVYKYKLRSMLRADPGCVLIEADFKSAELYCMAIMSGDPTLLNHCERNQLPENHPDYYDIHSSVAVKSFKLLCEPTKKGLESIGKIALRVGAKNVIFGICYGRGAAAIALQCKEEGNPITVAEAQAIIDSVFAMYPGLMPFLEACKSRATNERWLSSCFGRLRRFPFTEDRGMRGEFERQAMNFGIQSMVASIADRAVANIQYYRDYVLKDPTCFRLKLQIHDAIIVAAPYAKAAFVAEHVLPYNMTECVKIWPTDLAGIPTGAGPYKLGTDVEIFQHWGEKLPDDIRQKIKLAA